jgi:hypothetical protein
VAIWILHSYFASEETHDNDHKHQGARDPRLSRNPTVEAEVSLECGVTGRAAVPSGASTGEHELWNCAMVRRDAIWAKAFGRP